MTERPLADRIALVTGATRGIGAATTLALARAGAHVVAVGRTEGALEEVDDAVRAAGGSATLVPLDVTDYDAIDRLGAALYQRYGRLDVFVGNAGILGPVTPLGHVDPKDFDQAVSVNLTANYRFVRSLDPLLRLSTAGRAVFVTSGAAHKARAYWGPYTVTKAALEALGRTWAAETVTGNLKVNLFNPGPIRTRMRAKAFPGEDPMALEVPEAAAGAILSLCLPSCATTGKYYDFPTRTLLDFHGPA
ncbi:SDR family NAD(P)-dependent oxidoreductase [Aquabacter spiritensis]|uniref:NAD(P)-dependent dehydrogenase (Short-subunit alcohol dehydrogenase family) n=1 Tax=Aquabacter spiritensis TaxID=933073 RepID=A0A4R3LX51_9HYPH|nr:SDR family NAD(P)-dependent oxidoreductase [Aquabacter spiritensis]TCT05182.1 NAD(P)-dependent dehydrogenase (short-subunit alcohol dehydrogenase family) [Aquabacter spiritensis]